MSDQTIYYQKSKTILNRAKKYYKDNRERLREEARNEYRKLSEEKNIKREYGRNRYHNVSKENQPKLKEYQKIIVKLNINIKYF